MDRATGRWGRGLGVLGAAGLILVAAAGCAEPDPAVGESGLTWITAPDSDSGYAALAFGTVADAGGCLVIRSPEGEDLYPVFGRSDQRPGSLEVGDHVELGGGGIAASDPAWRTPDTWTVPEACSGAADLWIVAPK